MYLNDVFWTKKVNILEIECDCGELFQYPSNYSLVECPKCKYKEVWHEDALNFKELKKYKLMKMKIIKSYNQLIESKKETFKYEFGCVMLKLDSSKWKKDILSLINKDDIYDEEGFGLEKESHITLFFGILPDVDYNDVVNLLNGVQAPEYIELKNISIFDTNDNYDVVKFDIDDKNDMLTSIHNIISEHFPNKKTFEYHPHCTIAYVKKGRGVNYIQELKTPLIIKPSKIYYTYPKDNGKNKGVVDVINFK
jgi:hypothetical protein